MAAKVTFPETGLAAKAAANIKAGKIQGPRFQNQDKEVTRQKPGQMTRYIYPGPAWGGGN